MGKDGSAVIFCWQRCQASIASPQELKNFSGGSYDYSQIE
jgi:hypothetical protein